MVYVNRIAIEEEGAALHNRVLLLSHLGSAAYPNRFGFLFFSFPPPFSYGVVHFFLILLCNIKWQMFDASPSGLDSDISRERERVTAVWLHHYPSPSVRQLQTLDWNKLRLFLRVMRSYVLRK